MVSPKMCSNSNDFNVFYNEYLLKGNSLAEEYKFSYMCANFMGCRRSQIFVPDFAFRIINVCLPPGKIFLAGGKTDNASLGYIVVPVLTFTRKPQSAALRRTFSISIIMKPFSEGVLNSSKTIDNSVNPICKARFVTAREINDVLVRWSHNNSGKFVLSGPLFDFLLMNAKTFEMNMDDLLHLVVLRVSSLIEKQTLSEEETTEFRVQEDIAKQKFATLAPVGFKEPLLLRNENLREMLLETADSYNFFNNNPCETAFEELNVNEAKGLNPGRIVLYNPVENYLVAIHQDSSEKNFEKSIQRSFAWYCYTVAAMSSLKNLIHSFYSQTRRTNKLKQITSIEKQLIDDIDELYDLDLQYYNCKKVFKNVRRLSGIESDYKRLREKVSDLKTDLQIEETTHLNAVIVALTLALIFEPIYVSSLNFWALVASIFLPALSAVIVWFGLPEKLFRKAKLR
jgi:hypothetical protein